MQREFEGKTAVVTGGESDQSAGERGSRRRKPLPFMKKFFPETATCGR